MGMIKAAFIFPGQGAQFIGMGKELYEKFEASKKVFETANNVLDFDIADICFNGPAEKLKPTNICQLAILTVSIAALEALKTTDILNKYDISGCGGLSLGEYSALIASGVLTFEEGLDVTKKRGEIMKKVNQNTSGTMASVIGLSDDIIAEVCKMTGTEISNLNCPGQIVISGAKKSITEAIELAKHKGAKRVIPLDVEGAFHSSLMMPAVDNFRKIMNETNIFLPSIPVVSNVTGVWHTGIDQIRENMVQHLIKPVKWEEDIRFMVSEGIKVFFEIGPGKILKGLLRRIDKELKVYSIGTAEDIENL